MPLFGIKMHTSNVCSKHVYKNDLNVLIEQWPNPGLVQALSVKPDHKIHSFQFFTRDSSPTNEDHVSLMTLQNWMTFLPLCNTTQDILRNVCGLFFLSIHWKPVHNKTAWLKISSVFCRKK